VDPAAIDAGRGQKVTGLTTQPSQICPDWPFWWDITTSSPKPWIALKLGRSPGSM
jgi:hypothetical protein